MIAPRLGESECMGWTATWCGRLYRTETRPRPPAGRCESTSVRWNRVRRISSDAAAAFASNAAGFTLGHSTTASGGNGADEAIAASEAVEPGRDRQVAQVAPMDILPTPPSPLSLADGSRTAR
jgi:hypothetical protein